LNPLPLSQRFDESCQKNVNKQQDVCQPLKIFTCEQQKLSVIVPECNFIQ
jgi:hypothetical protein